MLEILSFRLMIDFFRRLSLFRIFPKEIRVFIFAKDKSKRTFYTFDGMDSLTAFYDEMYGGVDECYGLGDIWGIDFFSTECRLSTTFSTWFAVSGVSDTSFAVKPTREYDGQRMGYDENEYRRQMDCLSALVEEYRDRRSDLYAVYIKGLYAICYYVPEYGEHYGVLADYAGMLMDTATPEVSKRVFSVGEVKKKNFKWRSDLSPNGRKFTVSAHGGMFLDATARGTELGSRSINIWEDSPDASYIYKPHPVTVLSFDGLRLVNAYGKEMTATADGSVCDVQWTRRGYGMDVALGEDTLSVEIDGVPYTLAYNPDSGKFSFLSDTTGMEASMVFYCKSNIPDD